MRSFLHAIGLLSAAIVLTSCAGFQPLGTTFIRADGQEVSPDQLAADRSGCSDGSEKLEDCLAGKGYALVRDDEVAQKQKEFAANAEKKKQEQAALAAAEKKKQAALHRAAAKKKLKTTAAAPAASVQPASAAAQPAPANAAPAATNAQSSPWYPANQPPPPPEPQR
jgi:hypothetical protein